METFLVDQVPNALASLAFGCPCDNRRHIKQVSSRIIGESRIGLWHAIDVLDFSTFRSFVICDGTPEAFDVDFLSRHEIMPPMTFEKLPDGWQNWAIVMKNQMLITDRDAFCRKMMTPDAFVALPTYRFDFFADDVQENFLDKNEFCRGASDDVLDSMEDVLKSQLTGYAHKIYDLTRHGTEENLRDPVSEFRWESVEGEFDDKDGNLC